MNILYNYIILRYGAEHKTKNSSRSIVSGSGAVKNLDLRNIASHMSRYGSLLLYI